MPDSIPSPTEKADRSPGTDLRGASLSGADLRAVDFAGADLRGANLGGADLRKAVLTGARLRGANVAGADLTGADLTDADLVGLRADGETRWPAGFDPALRIVARERAAVRLSPDQKVLERYFDGDRLRRLPLRSDRKKILVLRRLVREFALGRRYTEREVSAALARFHEDYASLRRMLVDFRFLARKDGIYWRLWVESPDADEMFLGVEYPACLPGTPLNLSGEGEGVSRLPGQIVE